MRTVALTIDGTDYVAVPRADYLRLISGDDGSVDAVAYSRASLGRSLRAAREHAGFTQAELAKKLKRAQTTVSQSEAGKIGVSVGYVKKVLTVCGLPEDWTAP